jgi:uncharacterized damage-inducible protein DinB
MQRLLHRYFRMLTRYNEWSNARLYAKCATLDDASYREPRTVAGESVHDLLDIRLAADRLWLARLQGYEDVEERVEREAHSDFESLRDARVAEDVLLVELVDELSEEDLLRPVPYRDSAGASHADSQYELLTHLHVEQVESRARLLQLLQANGEVLDLAFLGFVREAYGANRPLGSE